MAILISVLKLDFFVQKETKFGSRSHYLKSKQCKFIFLKHKLIESQDIIL